jgi:hypothetical protein
MELSQIIPILKPNKPEHMYNSYRPIALQSNIFKLFEKLLMNDFLPFIDDQNIIPGTQYSYKNESIVNLNS